MVSDNWFNVRNILVVHTGHPDTTILIGPALRTLSQHLPQAAITLLVSPAGSEIASLLPGASEVMVGPDSWSQALSPAGNGQVELIERLRSRRFDAAIILTEPGQSPYPAAYACYLAGIPLRLGQSLEFGGGVLSLQVKQPGNNESSAGRHLHLLQAAGFNPAGHHLELSLPASVQPSVDDLFARAGLDPQGPFIALAFDPNQDLPRPGSTRLSIIRWLYKMERNWPFVLLGSRDVSHLVPSLRSLNPAGAIVSLAGQTSLVEFAAIISRARLVIASHPAPVRIAEAFNRPRMALSTEQDRSRPVLAPVTAQPAA